jgi:hypothetical protein
MGGAMLSAESISCSCAIVQQLRLITKIHSQNAKCTQLVKKSSDLRIVFLRRCFK